MCTWIFIFGLLQGESKLTQSLSRFRFELFIRIHHRGFTMSGCPTVNWMLRLIREFRWWQPELFIANFLISLSSNDLIHWSSLPESTSLTFNVLWDRETEKAKTPDHIIWAPESSCAWSHYYSWPSHYFFFFFPPHCVVCGILVPQPENEPRPQQWKHRVLTTGPPGKFPDVPIF